MRRQTAFRRCLVRKFASLVQPVAAGERVGCRGVASGVGVAVGIASQSTSRGVPVCVAPGGSSRRTLPGPSGRFGWARALAAPFLASFARFAFLLSVHLRKGREFRLGRARCPRARSSRRALSAVHAGCPAVRARRGGGRNSKRRAHAAGRSSPAVSRMKRHARFGIVALLLLHFSVRSRPSRRPLIWTWFPRLLLLFSWRHPPAHLACEQSLVHDRVATMHYPAPLDQVPCAIVRTLLRRRNWAAGRQREPDGSICLAGFLRLARGLDCENAVVVVMIFAFACFLSRSSITRPERDARSTRRSRQRGRCRSTEFLDLA